ncbi:tyrosine phosphatase-like protein [Scheffersomyces xylosifermentans]|uniref:tyrosine phosphatase-like protein n=1 Tax=Scheffersomyces xylosifermentans TaxID=1304137 RepID=UPI00315DB122
MPKFTSVYLGLYTIISTGLWAIILINAISDYWTGLNPNASVEERLSNIYLSHRYTGEYPHRFLVLTQLFNSVVEILNASVGLVNSSFATLILQASARSVITLGICYKVPQSPANYNLLVFNSIKLAWSLSEIIRNGFYLFKLSTNRIPQPVIWLRYSAFIVLYPLGLVCESLSMYSTLDSVKGSRYYYFVILSLTQYIPGFLILFSHMLKQRKKALRRTV